MKENEFVAHKLYVLLHSTYPKPVSVRILFRDHQEESWITSLPHLHDVIKHFPALFKSNHTRRLLSPTPPSLQMLSGYFKLASNVKKDVGYFKMKHKNWTKLVVTTDPNKECLRVQGLGGVISARNSQIYYTYSLPKNQGSVALVLQNMSSDEFLEMFPNGCLVSADLTFAVPNDGHPVVRVDRVQQYLKPESTKEPKIWTAEIPEDDTICMEDQLKALEDTYDGDACLEEITTEDKLLAFNLVLWFLKMDFGFAGVFTRESIVEFIQNNIEHLSGRKYTTVTNQQVIVILQSFPLLFKNLGYNWRRVALKCTDLLLKGIFSLTANVDTDEILDESLELEPIKQEPRIVAERSYILVKNLKGKIKEAQMDQVYYANIPNLLCSDVNIPFSMETEFELDTNIEYHSFELRIAVNRKHELIAAVFSVNGQETLEASRHVWTLEQIKDLLEMMEQPKDEEDTFEEAQTTDSSDAEINSNLTTFSDLNMNQSFADSLKLVIKQAVEKAFQDFNDRLQSNIDKQDNNNGAEN